MGIPTQCDIQQTLLSNLFDTKSEIGVDPQTSILEFDEEENLEISRQKILREERIARAVQDTRSIQNEFHNMENLICGSA